MSEIKLLSCLIEDDGEGSFRLLVDNKAVKYVIIQRGLYEPMDMCFGPRLAELLPPLPSGEWRFGYIARNPADGEPYFEITDNTPLPGVQCIWHPVEMSHLKFDLQVRLKTNVWEATAAEFDGPVVLKFAALLWEISWVDDETEVYNWIQGHDIGPKFLGHLTEDDGRIYGMILEKITDARPAGPQDVSLCKDVVRKLHSLGIIHRDINRFNFLIREGRATLVDFESACKSTDPAEFEAELNEIERALNSKSPQGTVWTEAADWSSEDESVISSISAVSNGAVNLIETPSQPKPKQSPSLQPEGIQV